MSEPAPPRAPLEELDARETRMGELALRRRLEPVLQVELYEG